jgi:hypothetical protein
MSTLLERKNFRELVHYLLIHGSRLGLRNGERERKETWLLGDNTVKYVTKADKLLHIVLEL